MSDETLSFLFTLCLFTFFFLRFTLFTPLKLTYLWYLNFPKIDRPKATYRFTRDFTTSDSLRKFFSALLQLLKNSRRGKLIDKIVEDTVKRTYELKEFHASNHFWALELLKSKILQMLKTIIIVNKKSKKSIKNKKTKTSFKKSSRYSTNWTIDNSVVKKTIEKF